MKRHVLILSGPTHEYLDPVRFFGNASSGKMGRALALEAVGRDFEVEFVTGPVPEERLPVAPGIRIRRVVSAEEMLAAARPLFTAADVAIFAAAVADYAPAERLERKRAKREEEWLLRLRPTPDLAQTLCAEKRPEQVAFGFALQTDDGEANARRKLEKKHLDGIVLNTPATLGANEGLFSFLSAGRSEFEVWGKIAKAECARRLFDALETPTEGAGKGAPSAAPAKA